MSQIDDGGVAYCNGPHSYVSVRDAVARSVFEDMQQASDGRGPYRETVEAAYDWADAFIWTRSADYLQALFATNGEGATS